MVRSASQGSKVRKQPHHLAAFSLLVSLNRFRVSDRQPENCRPVTWNTRSSQFHSGFYSLQHLQVFFSQQQIQAEMKTNKHRLSKTVQGSYIQTYITFIMLLLRAQQTNQAEGCNKQHSAPSFNWSTENVFHVDSHVIFDDFSLPLIFQHVWDQSL